MRLFVLSGCMLLFLACADRHDIVGRKKWSYWKNHSGWADAAGAKYDPNPGDIDKLRRQLHARNISFVLFAGTWCRDSGHEVPRLMKALKMAGINTDEMEVIGTGSDRKSPEGLIKKYRIKYNPTLIILSDGRETGRIEEKPDNSWERDIWQLIKLHHQ